MSDPLISLENDMQRALVIVPVLFGLLATTAVGLRFLASHIARRPLNASDYTMIAALIITTALCALIASEPFTSAAGMHTADIMAIYGNAPVITYTKMTLANQVLWALAVCLPKLSILILYKKIFTLRVFVILAQVTGAIILLLGIATILGALLQCHPFAYNWDQTIPGGHCGNQVLSFKITATLNVVLDVIIVILPMPYFYDLELALSKKLILMATFAGGFVTCIFSALRIAAILNIDYSDLTYFAGLPSIYSVLEPTLSITLACVPMLRPLLGGNYSPTGTWRASGPKENSVTTVGQRTSRSRSMANAGFHSLDELDSTDDVFNIQLHPLGTRHETRISAGGQD